MLPPCQKHPGAPTNASDGRCSQCAAERFRRYRQAREAEASAQGISVGQARRRLRSKNWKRRVRERPLAAGEARALAAAKAQELAAKAVFLQAQREQAEAASRAAKADRVVDAMLSDPEALCVNGHLGFCCAPKLLWWTD